MDEKKKQKLADLLARRYRQADRVALLSSLGVDPEECTLGAAPPHEVAWRMVRWFEDRGRFDELDRAARASWLRRLMRRVSLASVPGALGVFVLVFGFDGFGVQGRLCRMSLGQPGLSDACGAWGLGGAAAKEERIAWEGRERGSCEALREHVKRFPDGAYAKAAEARIVARRIEVEETWTPRKRGLELFVGSDVPPERDRAAAEASVQARARAEAERLCGQFVERGHRLRSSDVLARELKCPRDLRERQCSLVGQAVCEIDERGVATHERCDE